METKIYSFYVLKSDISPNEIRYVGVTTQKSINQRLTQHRYNARHPEKRGLPVHKWMYSVYEKGGNILIEKINECAESEWEEREQFLIQKYKDLGHRLLNVDKGGKGVITKEKRSIDSITRSIEAHKKPIIAYNFDGTKYMEFSSLTKAAEYLNAKVNNIGMALKGRSKSACGYIWKYKSENIESTKAYKKEEIGTKVYQYDLNGNLLKEFSSKKEVLDYVQANSYTTLGYSISNGTEYKGYFWSLSPDMNIVNFVSPYKFKIINGDNITKVIQQKEVAKILGISKTTVCTWLKKYNGTFKYNEYIVESI